MESQFALKSAHEHLKKGSKRCNQSQSIERIIKKEKGARKEKEKEKENEKTVLVKSWLMDLYYREGFLSDGLNDEGEESNGSTCEELE